MGAFGLKRTAIGLPMVGGRRFDFPPCFPARHGLGIAWARLEDHPSEAPEDDWRKIIDVGSVFDKNRTDINNPTRTSIPAI